MQQRDTRRVKRRITCEFFYRDEPYKGIVLDVDPGGLFIRTNAVIPPGSAIGIHLSASSVAPAMTLLGEVARRRAAPANLSSIMNRGVGVRILDAPPEYALLFRTTRSDVRESDPESVEMEVEVEVAIKPEATPRPRRTAPQPISTLITGVSRRIPNPRRPPKVPTIGVNDPDPSSKPAGPPTAVLIGDDALQEIADVLAEFGVDVVRRGPDDLPLDDLTDARLIVASAQLALARALPVGGIKTVRIAVCNEASKTMHTMLERRGYKYLLRQPVHNEALRLLFRYALFDKPDRRARRRLPFGYSVSWRVGWRQERGSLLEISPDGCRLLAPRLLTLDARIRIKIPAEVAGGRTLRLRGKVIRNARNNSHERGESYAVGVVFDGLAGKVREHLARVSELWSDGPPVLPKAAVGPRDSVDPKIDEPMAPDSVSDAVASQPNDPPIVQPIEEPIAECALVDDEAESQTTPDRPGDVGLHDDESPAAATTRRRYSRGRLDQEVVEVDAEQHVVQALLGRDLSMGGIRVDPQLGLEPGDKTRIAIFDRTRGEPMILHAVVARDDGGSGIGLHFVDLSADDEARLAELIAALPAIESLGSSGFHRVVPSAILSSEDTAPSC